MKFSRSIKSSIVLALPLAFMMQGNSLAAETCLCEAHFELRAPSNGRPAFDASFKPDIPLDHFSAAKGKGAGTMGACRREAQQRAHNCMQQIWEKRWSDEKPNECSTSRGIRGSVPYEIKYWIERTACEGSSPIADKVQNVAVWRRTHGNLGCGGGTKKAKSVFISNYEVDCPATRHREKLGLVAQTEIQGIDRPGENLGQGGTVGDGSVGACKTTCNLHSQCKSWTWVPAGILGPQSQCWVKKGVPHFKRFPQSAGMVSGTREHVSQ